jgi:hypothetical protein
MSTGDDSSLAKPKDRLQSLRATQQSNRASVEAGEARQRAWLAAYRAKRTQGRLNRIEALRPHEQRLRHTKAAYDRHSARGNERKASNLNTTAECVVAEVAKIFGDDTAGLALWCIAQPVNYLWLSHRLHTVGVHIPPRH